MSLLSLGPLPSSAIELLNTTNFVVGAGERLEKEHWVLAEETSIEGAVGDDLLVASPRFTLRGTVEGDLWLMATEAEVGGTAGSQVRVLAQSLLVTGRVERSLAAVAPSIRITSNAVVGGDALLRAATATVRGSIEGDVDLFANQVTLQGRIGGDARLVAGDIVLLPGTVIEGDLLYTSDKDLVPGKDVTVGGVVEYRALPVQRVGFAQRLASAFLYAAAALLTGLVALRLMPGTMGRAARLMRHATGRCILAGVIAMPAMALGCLAGIWLVVTRPLALIAGGLLLTLGYLGHIVVALVIGSALLRYRGARGFGQAAAALAAGLGVLYILSALPTIGLVLWLGAATLGLGALVSAYLTRAVPPPTPWGAPAAPDEPGQESDRKSNEP